MTIIYVYVAGPLTLGDQDINTREAVKVADILAQEGFVPFVPHLDRLWHLISPHHYEFWMKICLAWVARCDALIRLPGESKGGDREVEHARKLGIPVFGDKGAPMAHAIRDLLEARAAPPVEKPPAGGGGVGMVP